MRRRIPYPLRTRPVVWLRKRNGYGLIFKIVVRKRKGYGMIFKIVVRKRKGYGLIFKIVVRKRNVYGSIFKIVVRKRNGHGNVSKPGQWDGYGNSNRTTFVISSQFLMSSIVVPTIKYFGVTETF